MIFKKSRAKATGGAMKLNHFSASPNKAPDVEKIDPTPFQVLCVLYKLNNSIFARCCMIAGHLKADDCR
jgi:hypothetical protein